MASELRVNTLKDASGNNSVAISTVYSGSAKVWSGVATTSATAGDNFNISSLVDDATGRTSHNFTSALTNTDFIAVYGARSGGISDAYVNDYNATDRTTSKNTSQAQAASTGGFADITYASMAIHGDLA